MEGTSNPPIALAFDRGTVIVSGTGAASLPLDLPAVWDPRVAAYRAAAFRVEGGADRAGYYDEHGQPLQKTFLKSPLSYRRFSSGFSNARRHPITRQVVPHHGVDFAAPSGTPVVASGREAGTIGTPVAGNAVAILRLDRVTDPAAVTVAGRPVSLELPPWATYRFGESTPDD